MLFNDSFTTLVRQSLEAGSTPALMGEPGIGKSSFVEDLAYSMNTRAFVLPCNQLADKADLTGARLVPTDSGSYTQVFYPHHVITECIDYALDNPNETPLLLLDEINRTTSDVTSGALTMVTLRKMGHIEIPKNVRIIIAGNTKGNVTTLDDASLSRFTIFNLEPDAQTLLGILGDDVNPWVKKVLVAHPELVFTKKMSAVVAADGDDDDDDSGALVSDLFEAGEDMAQFTTPRTIDNVSRWLNIASMNELGTYLATPTTINGRQTSLLNEVLEGFTGDTLFTTQLVATIADDLASGSNGSQASRVNVPKPASFNALAQQPTITDMQNHLQTMSPSELSGNLIYAIHDSADHSTVIEHLAYATAQIEAAHTRSLMEMLTRDQYNKANLQSFLGVQAPLVDQMRNIIEAYI